MQACLGTLARCASTPHSALEIAAARGVAALSRRLGSRRRHDDPGKLLAELDRGAIDRLAARLAAGTAVVSATNGKTTTDGDGGRDPAPAIPARAQRRGREPRLGRRLRRCSPPVTPTSGCSRWTRRRSRSSWGACGRERVCLGNLFRDQLDRYGELELVAERWRDASRPCLRRRGSSTTPTTRSSPRSARRTPAASPSASTTRAWRAPSLQHAADSKYCVRCGTPYDYAAAYVGHLGDYRCPRGDHARPPLEVAARDVSLHGLERAAFRLDTPEGSRRVELGLPGLYNVYNAVAAAALARALGADLDEIAAGLERFSAAFGRFERIAVGGKRILLLLIKNPAGANEAVRTLVDGGAPRLVVVALNDEIADGRDVSWIWDVDFEPLLAGPRDARRERRPRGRARAALPLRRARRGRDRGRA